MADEEQEVAEASRPFWVKCPSCSHCWPAAYFPMDVMKFANIAEGARCPKCGDRKPVIAKQAEGVLLEGEAA